MIEKLSTKKWFTDGVNICKFCGVPGRDHKLHRKIRYIPEKNFQVYLKWSLKKVKSIKEEL